MDVYIAFTKKESIKIDEWKKSLPKTKKGVKRTYGIQFYSMEELNKDGHKLFKARFMSNDGHKLLITRKAAFH
jgi:hypothetical protein